MKDFSGSVENDRKIRVKEFLEFLWKFRDRLEINVTIDSHIENSMLIHKKDFFPLGEKLYE